MDTGHKKARHGEYVTVAGFVTQPKQRLPIRRAAETLESHVDSQSVNECGFGGSNSARFDDLKVWRDIEPRLYLEVVEEFHTAPIARAK